MPIYEYKCKKCNKITERYFSMNNFPQYDVCDCGGESFKIISLTTFNMGTWAEGFHPGLGEYCKTEKEIKEKCKKLSHSDKRTGEITPCW